jgi:hypothetical protein
MSKIESINLYATAGRGYYCALEGGDPMTDYFPSRYVRKLSELAELLKTEALPRVQLVGTNSASAVGRIKKLANGSGRVLVQTGSQFYLVAGGLQCQKS